MKSKVVSLTENKIILDSPDDNHRVENRRRTLIVQEKDGRKE